MPGDLTIQHARLVLPDRCVTGDLVIRDGTIEAIGPRLADTAGEVIDGTNLLCMPGAIDAQVHFRDPGLTHKEDMRTGSRAAAAVGVTAYLDLPNTQPTTTTVAALEAKLAHAAENSVVHYGFFIGATGDNLEELLAADRACGIQASLGRASGGLSVVPMEALDAIFAASNLLVAVHAEDDARLAERLMLYADSTDVADHARVRDVETAVAGLHKALKLAHKHGSRLHIMRLSSEEELALLEQADRNRVSADVCLPHLMLDADSAYVELGSRAQSDPPIRAARHRDALWRALLTGGLDLVASNHAPHTQDEKAKDYPDSPSGMPGVEWLLPLLLDRVNAGLCSVNDVARWVCEGPAATYGIRRKGRLEVGYDGDIVLVDMAEERVIDAETVRCKVGWSPYVGRRVQGWPVLTAVMGRPVFRDGGIVPDVRGKELTFTTNESGQHRTPDASVRPWQVG